MRRMFLWREMCEFLRILRAATCLKLSENFSNEPKTILTRITRFRMDGTALTIMGKHFFAFLPSSLLPNP